MPIEELKRPERIDEERIDKLKELFPEAFVDGKFNLDIFKEEIDGLHESLIEEDRTEFYGLQWVGKKDSRKLAYLPPKGTLKLIKGAGINEETTENSFIRGDNLEVLRILKKGYSGQIKMIYIDPPYNTGSDFIYKDNFKEPVESYLQKAGQADDEGLLTSNPKSSGRFHANWLNMMYPRLKLAKDLLSNDGIIFVSIDDNEQANLKLLMDSIFGTDNFIAQLIWNTEGHTDNQYHVKVNHEYILMYVKNQKYKNEAIGNVVDPNTRAESNLWKGFAENSITKNGPANPPSEIVLPVGFPCVVDNLDLEKSEVEDGFFEEVGKLGYITRDLTRKYNVTYPIRNNEMIVRKGKLQNECKVYSGWANANKLRTFINNGCNPIDDGGDKIQFYLSKNGVIYYKKERESARNILSVLRNMGTTEQMRSSLEEKSIKFDYPKPVDLIKYLLKIGTKHDSIIMDFFAGSGTTARAVYELNKEDNGKRNFILIQLEEELKSNEYSNIAELTEERIRKDLEEFKGDTESDENLDLGFAVYRMDRSTIRKWETIDNENTKSLEGQLDLFTSKPFLSDVENSDIIREIMLVQGYPLNSGIETVKLSSNQFWKIKHPNIISQLIICLDEQLEEESVKYLSTNNQNDVFICLDSSLTNNQKIILSESMNVKTI